MYTSLTTTQILAAASEVLVGSGYVEVASAGEPGSAGDSRTFEDAYSIAAVHAFDTWAQLAEQWPRAQGQLVELISAHLRLPEPKAWDGYIVLLTPDVLPPEEKLALAAIRNDTTRVRKLVASGEELTALSGIHDALLPLLPLRTEQCHTVAAGPLEHLPELLEEAGVPRRVVEDVVDAFNNNESILERIHESRMKQ